MDLGFSYIIPKSEMGFRNYIKHMQNYQKFAFTFRQRFCILYLSKGKPLDRAPI